MEPLLTEKQVVVLYNTSRATLRRGWRDGIFPKPIRIGKRGIRWRREDIEAHIANSPRATLSKVGAN